MDPSRLALPARLGPIDGPIAPRRDLLALLNAACGFPGGGFLAERSCFAGGAVLSVLDHATNAAYTTPFSDINVYVRCDGDGHCAGMAAHNCGCGREWRRLLGMVKWRFPDCLFHVYRKGTTVTATSQKMAHAIQLILHHGDARALVATFDLDAVRCAVFATGEVFATRENQLARTTRVVRSALPSTTMARWYTIGRKGFSTSFPIRHDQCQLAYLALQAERKAGPLTWPPEASIDRVIEIARRDIAPSDIAPSDIARRDIARRDGPTIATRDIARRDGPTIATRDIATGACGPIAPSDLHSDLHSDLLVDPAADPLADPLMDHQCTDVSL